MTNKSILVVEDERDIGKLVGFNLEREGYKVESALSGEDGLILAKEVLPDLVVLDIMLPGLNGLDVCRALRSDQETKNIPIILLTAKNEEIDDITDLEVGADDYITKPFSPKVLIARIRAVLRRGETDKEENSLVDVIGDLAINKEKHRVTVFGNQVELTFTEFDLLCLLADRPGWVFSRSQLIASLREGQHVITERAIDVQIVNIRKKLGSCGSYIETVRGVGYRMKELT